MRASMTILDSFGVEVPDSGTSTTEESSTLVFTYKVPSEQAGGEYQIRIESPDFPTAFRKFRIN